MENLVWIGSGLTGLGFAGVVWSIVLVTRAKRAGLDDDALRARLHKALPVNLGGLFLAFFGLILVIVGVILA